jgi:hypothetical protein
LQSGSDNRAQQRDHRPRRSDHPANRETSAFTRAACASGRQTKAASSANTAAGRSCGTSMRLQARHTAAPPRAAANRHGAAPNSVGDHRRASQACCSHGWPGIERPAMHQCVCARTASVALAAMHNRTQPTAAQCSPAPGRLPTYC